MIRRFGNKAEPIERARGAAGQHDPDASLASEYAPADLAGIIAVLITDYERSGDLVVRTLNQEDRIPEFGAVLDQGRHGHRESSWFNVPAAGFVVGNETTTRHCTLVDRAVYCARARSMPALLAAQISWRSSTQPRRRCSSRVTSSGQRDLHQHRRPRQSAARVPRTLLSHHLPIEDSPP